MKRLIPLIVTACLFTFRLFASISLDHEFADGGALYLRGQGFSQSRGHGEGILVRDSGGFVVFQGVSFSGEFKLSQFLPDGRPDESFGNRGVVLLDSHCENGGLIEVSFEGKIFLQTSDGDLIVGGHCACSEEMFLFRIQPNGELDINFGLNGRASISLEGLDRLGLAALDAHGRIFVPYSRAICPEGECGANDWRWISGVLAVTNQGAINVSFGDNGKFETLASMSQHRGAVLAKIDQENRILIGEFLSMRDADGSAMLHHLLLRLTPSGSLDTTFASSGQLTLNDGSSGALDDVELLSDGSILMAFRNSRGSTAIRKITSVGQVDPLFGSNGIFTLPGLPLTYSNDISLSPSGKIFILSQLGYAGLTLNYGRTILYRISSSGHLDERFGQNGIVEFLPAIQAEDKPEVVPLGFAPSRIDPYKSYVAVADKNNSPATSIRILKLYGDLN